MNHNYLAAMSEELKKRVQERIQLLNSKLEVDIFNAKKDCIGFDDKLTRELKHWVNNHCDEMIHKESIRQTFVMDEKTKQMKKDLSEKVDHRI